MEKLLFIAEFGYNNTYNINTDYIIFTLNFVFYLDFFFQNRMKLLLKSQLLNKIIKK